MDEGGRTFYTSTISIQHSTSNNSPSLIRPSLKTGAPSPRGKDKGVRLQKRKIKMSTITMLVCAGAVFALCFFIDKGFAKLFRSKAQHMSGLAVRANKRYGVFGVVLTALGVAGICMGSDKVLLFAGGFVAILGICLGIYYLSFGVFYDGETFLVSRFAKASREYRFGDIQGQKLYLVQGGNIIVELHMADQTVVSLQSTMDGVYPFLDTAFAAWCIQNGREPQSCDFHDPSQSLWFPTVEEV